MNNRTFLFSIFSILILIACNGPTSPEFKKLENVQFKSTSFLNGLTVTLTSDAIFHNPNPIGAKVTEVDLDVFINGKQVTRVKQDLSVDMKAKSDFTLPLEFEIPLQEVYKDLKPTLGDLFKKKKIEYKLDGDIKVGLGNVELRVPVVYEDQEEIRLK